MGKIADVLQEVGKAVKGKDECILKTFAAILAGGHVLIEDVPGVGKTTLALAFSKVLNLENRRIQLTPDVLPADIVGFSMYRKEKECFEYHEGVVMCNVLLADEINRTSPKTQSALLEVMEEGRVTVDGKTREVPKPFVVMATQNPKGSAGTQLLPESQLDRFMICISMGYPDLVNEIEILKGTHYNKDMIDVAAIMSKEELIQCQKEVDEIFVSDDIYRYIVRLSDESRNDSYIELGISPRGTIACAKMAKAMAYLDGRTYVIPEDVDKIYLDVTKHRIVLNTKARVSHITSEEVLKETMKRVKQPASYMKRGKRIV